MNLKNLQKRRHRLARMIGDDAVIFLRAAPTARYSMDVDYLYRQDNDFFYLTGFTEPDALAVITARGKQDEPEFILFCRPNDPLEELWTGARAGCRQAKSRYGANHAFPIGELNKKLPQLLRGRKKVYCHFNTPLATELLGVIGECRRGMSVSSLEDPGQLIDKMRLRKSAEEISLMKKAATISMAAHKHVMRMCREGLFEYEIAAAMEYEFARAGARVAYPTIAGSGNNACILHYVENSRRLQKGDLLLLDAGAEYAHYAADITRTFPVNGRFTAEQRDLYETVLEAQTDAIQVTVPGGSLSETHNAAVKSLTRGLVRLGLLKGRVANLIKRGDYKRFYMHGTSHWLGMDVHDCQRLSATSKDITLRMGMVMTVEPGLYIPAARDIPKYWRGTGVRIEDDVLITARGNKVLTEGLAKHPDDIEREMMV